MKDVEKIRKNLKDMAMVVGLVIGTVIVMFITVIVVTKLFG